MKKIFRLLQWLFKGLVFFTLFAFALNNLEDVSLHFFFGTQWTGPMVLVVLAVFALGLITGIVGMLPNWWKHKKELKKSQTELQAVKLTPAPAPSNPTNASPQNPTKKNPDLTEGDIHGV